MREVPSGVGGQEQAADGVVVSMRARRYRTFHVAAREMASLVGWLLGPRKGRCHLRQLGWRLRDSRKEGRSKAEWARAGLQFASRFGSQLVLVGRFGSQPAKVGRASLLGRLRVHPRRHVLGAPCQHRADVEDRVAHIEDNERCDAHALPKDGAQPLHVP